MNIKDILRTLVAEKIFRRTPSGRPLTEFAIETLNAAIEDEKNHDQPSIVCLNCNFIISSLLVPEGCPSCGAKDLTMTIKQTDIL